MQGKRSTRYLLGILLAIALGILFYAFEGKGESDVLEVTFLDVGQGDAILIEAPNGRQMIVDGGPNNTLMQVLPHEIGFSDRNIDVMVITNPDADHISGFLELLARYDIGSIIEPGTTSDTETYSLLEEAIQAEGVPHILARAGAKVMLDEVRNVYFEILFPDRDVSNWDRNDGSIVGRLVYGETSFLLMGDATILTEGIVTSKYDLSGTEVLKLGHHGSRTSSGPALLEETNPSVAIISAGSNNRYGHPHREVLERLNNLHIPYLQTSESGTIVFESNGYQVVQK